jgi:hypothetical protein
MGHTQLKQNNNNRPWALVCAKIHVFQLPGHVHVHGNARVYARFWHIKRAMQEPELSFDWPSMNQVARLQCSAAGWILGWV